MSRVIFLDIDGPMIPGRQYAAKGGTQRRAGGALIGYRFDPSSVNLVTHLARTADARIVWNTTHNARGITQLTEDAVASGLDHQLFHADPQTEYPGEVKFSGYAWSMTRLKAIRRWLAAHPEVTHWVAFDDDPIRSKNAVRIDFQSGITSGHVDKAMAILGVDAPKLVVV